MMLTNFRLTRRALGAMLLLVALAPAVALSQDQGPTAPSTAA